VSGKLVLFGPFPPPAGGVAVFMSSLAAHMGRLGIDHRVRAYGGSGPAGVPCVEPTVTSVLRRFVDLGVADTCFDSSGIFVEYPAVNATRAWLALHRLRRFRWVKMLHDGTLPSRWQELPAERRRAAASALAAADVLVAVNEDLATWLDRSIGITANVQLIGSLLPIGDENGSAPAALDDLPGALVCSIGAFTPNYGFAAIARAVEALRRELGTNITLALVETSFARDDAYAADVLRDRTWITELRDLPRATVIATLRRSDVLVRATGSESYGLAKAEAVLVGTPVVATAVGETRGALLFSTEEQLVEALRAVLRGQVRGDQGQVADTFRREAEGNLGALIRVLRQPS
jgi:glycosyltransferase involved in cell wall biosynthesis